jgi:hypothetical protein
LSHLRLLTCCAASFHGHVTSFSSQSGDIQWYFDAGSSVTSVATVQTSDGRIDVLVVGTAAGSVYALSCADGSLLWGVVFEGSVAVAAGEITQAEWQLSINFSFILCSAARNRVFALDSGGKRMHALQLHNGARAF